MCGRFALVPSSVAWAPIRAILGDAVADVLIAQKARYNIAPSATVPIVIHDRTLNAPGVIEARWGLVPHWWKNAAPPSSTINARSEDAAGKPMWRDAWKFQRCLIPATHWYEWRQEQGLKVPHAITRGDGKDGFMFAGLWSRWTAPDGEELLSYAILTTAAAPSVVHIHERMPVVLAPGAWLHWLDPALRDAQKVAELLKANTLAEFNTRRVSRRLNSARNDDPGLLDGVPDLPG
ncbi:SOS response-associated peptidase [Nevskia soli]|uniref:SOS response-associated peptidase n=1 Tax=Nevskia soli TaxID=418856 RepID=UPI0004A6AEA6|nr:SOS response-associated peptidase [Nevskia soli]